MNESVKGLLFLIKNSNYQIHMENTECKHILNDKHQLFTKYVYDIQFYERQHFQLKHANSTF